MSKVKVYKFEVWNQATGMNKVALRMATRECIAMARGRIIEGTEREINSSLLNENGQADISIQPIR
jgi:hypothetical protein